MKSSNYVIISDIHGKGRYIDEVLSRQIYRPEAIIFAGDGIRDLTHCSTDIKILGVRGNCDMSARAIMPDGNVEEFDEERLLFLDGKRILLLHGHTAHVKHSLSYLISRAADMDADAVIFGHTHEPLELSLPKGYDELGAPLKKPLHLFNPGSLGSGSFGTLELRCGQMIFGHGRV